MKIQKQLNGHDPKNGLYGDCVRTSIASMLDLDANDVPHFFDKDVDGEEGWNKVNNFLKKYNLCCFSFPFENSIKDKGISGVLKIVANYQKDCHYIIGCGTRARGVDHVIVAKGEKIILDPSTGREESDIDQYIIDSSGYVWVHVIAKIL